MSAPVSSYRMIVASLHTGTPRRETFPSGALVTGGAKAQAAGAMLRFEGFEGDGVADHRHHGGPDRTACVYPAEHYAWWNSVHGWSLRFGAFSENLTVEGAREGEICIGDIVRIGKEGFYRQAEMSLAEAYRYVSEVMVENLMARDAEEGLNAFIDKREPKWEDR